MKVTTQAIKNITHRNVIKVVEMAYVVLAVFESGRPQFVSKKAIACEVAQWDSGRDSEKFDQEWAIKPATKIVVKAVNPLAAYEFAVALGCNVRDDHWTPSNSTAKSIVLRRPTDDQLAKLVAFDSNWDAQWGVYEIAA